MKDQPGPIKARAATPDEVQKLLGQHKQLRELSCFQSAPEMWLKLKNVIGWTDYPEQSLTENDGKGYEPYPVNGTKTYNGSAIHFQKETFHAPYEKLFERLPEEIAQGGSVVVSLRPPWGGGWHGYLVTHQVGDDFLIFSKDQLNDPYTHEDRLKNRLEKSEQVDCLFMQIAGK